MIKVKVIHVQVMKANGKGKHLENIYMQSYNNKDALYSYMHGNIICHFCQ